jgi:HD-GYP domain-containing protein (c-di-GMP phosphodiesterase class II)
MTAHVTRIGKRRLVTAGRPRHDPPDAMDESARTYLDAESEELVAAARDRNAGLRGTRRESVARAASALVVVAGALAFLAVPSARPLSVFELVCLVAGYACALRVAFEIGPGFAMPTEVLFVPMLLLLPPPVVPAAVVAGLALSAVPDVLTRSTAPASVAARIASGGFAFLPAAVALGVGTPGADASDWQWVPLLVAAQFAGDFASSAVSELAALGVDPRRLAGPLRWVFSVDALLAPLGLAVAAAATVSHVAILLPLPLLLLVARFSHERTAAISSSLELSRTYRGTALLLGDVVEADDAYTGRHSRAVVDLSIAVAERLSVSADERRLTELVALLHDVGKIRIPKEIIQKPGALNTIERSIVERHTIEGEALLSTVGGVLAEVGALVRSCHERWDGNGYPDGLAGEEIPLVARIVCCADAFDAMTTDRPYRRALPVADAIAELRRCSGTQFDPAVVDAALVGIAASGRAADQRVA